MAKKQVSIDGLEDILKKLQRFENQSEKTKEILFEPAKFLREKIEKEASKLDDSIEDANNDKYGRLEENIWLEWDEEKKTSYITIGSAYWGFFLEHGTRNQPAQPFMEPTFNRNKNAIVKKMNESAKRILGL